VGGCCAINTAFTPTKTEPAKKLRRVIVFVIEIDDINESMDDHAKMTEIIMGFVPAQAVSVAAELGIADLLAKEPMSAERLAEETHTNPKTLFRLLRFLASIGIFQVDGMYRFSLTPLASLLRSGTPDSMRPMAQIMGRLGPRTVNHLLDAVQSAKYPFQVAYGKHLFEYLSEHPQDAGIFDAAMNGFHGSETDAVLDAYNFAGISALADIGCGNGTVLSATLKRHPSMRGIFFDRPHVIERARRAIQAEGLSDRSEILAGSFFEGVPGGADAYFMRHIIHDWSDEPALQILRNIRQKMPPQGRLLIVEMIVPEGNDPSIAKGFDITMMLFPDGLERTEKEYRRLLEKGGFELSGITPTASSVSVIEAKPL
jgi:O-methyltransferase domain/Dimerisation domain